MGRSGVEAKQSQREPGVTSQTTYTPFTSVWRAKRLRPTTAQLICGQWPLLQAAEFLETLGRSPAPSGPAKKQEQEWKPSTLQLLQEVFSQHVCTFRNSKKGQQVFNICWATRVEDDWSYLD